MDSTEKFKKDVEYKINKHIVRLGIDNNIGTTARDLYSKFNSEDNAYARPDDIFAIASIYLAHKVRKEPTSVSDLIDGTDIDDKHVVRAYKKMQKTLASEYDIDISTFTPYQYIEKFGKELGVGSDVINEAKSINDKTEEIMINNANITRGAASLYLACIVKGVDITQKKMADVSGITSVTIRNRYKEQAEYLGISE